MKLGIVVIRIASSNIIGNLSFLFLLLLLELVLKLGWAKLECLALIGEVFPSEASGFPCVLDKPGLPLASGGSEMSSSVPVVALAPIGVDTFGLGSCSEGGASLGDSSAGVSEDSMCESPLLIPFPSF